MSRDWDGNVGKFLAAGPLLNGMAGAAAQAGRFGPEPRAIATAALPISQSALSIWRQKLEFMLVEDALCVDPAMKFRLKHLITEAQEKIHLLGG